MAPSIGQRARYWPAGGISAIGAALLVYQWYRTRPFWVDEEMIALNLRDRGFGELTGALWLNQAAPLGWLALQRLVLVAFDTGERSLRAVPVIFGMATLMLAWWAGRRWMGPLGATLFVLLCSFGQYIAFFPLETKHYSADAFFGLLLPVLAVWALERNAGARPFRRIVSWWAVAAVAQWFSSGALVTAPGCAIVLLALVWRRAGFQSAVTAAIPGLIWATSFFVHYQLSLRHAVQSEYLRNYWATTFPEAGASIPGALRWLSAQLEPLARNPGGTDLWITYWLLAIAGMTFAARRFPLGLFLLALPVSAFVLAALRLVPLSGRLSLWTLPALYGGIALAADAAYARAGRTLVQRDWMRGAIALLILFVALRVGWDIFYTGQHEIAVRPMSNHQLDDRSALRFLVAQQRPGDALASTLMGLPAIWWYGGIDVAAPHLGRAGAMGNPVIEVKHYWPGPDCRAPDLSSGLAGVNRVALYLGFDSNTPAGFQVLVLDRLSELGRMTSHRRIAEEGVAAVFDLTLEPVPWTTIVTRPEGQALKDPVRAPGCAGFHTATRW